LADFYLRGEDRQKQVRGCGRKGDDCNRISNQSRGGGWWEKNIAKSTIPGKTRKRLRRFPMSIFVSIDIVTWKGIMKSRSRVKKVRKNIHGQKNFRKKSEDDLFLKEVGVRT